MPSCKDTIFVERSIEAVFDVATTAKHWTTWHPQTKDVKGAIDSPLQPNDIVTEKVLLAGQKRWVEWVCSSRDPPRTLRLDGKCKGIKITYIDYTFISRDGGTEFTRFFFYRFHPLLKLVELLTKSMLRKLQTVAMNQMKEFLLKEIPK